MYNVSSLLSSSEQTLIKELLIAFRECRRGKGGTHEVQEYLMSYMSRTVQLARRLVSGEYELSRFISFVSFWPVLREIYGSAFIDRVVDTWISAKLIPLLDRQFVTDNYSTRKEKGALFGVRRVSEMIRQCSEDYSRDCWILKDDIKSFFR